MPIRKFEFSLSCSIRNISIRTAKDRHSPNSPRYSMTRKSCGIGHAVKDRKTESMVIRRDREKGLAPKGK